MVPTSAPREYLSVPCAEHGQQEALHYPDLGAGSASICVSGGMVHPRGLDPCWPLAMAAAAGALRGGHSPGPPEQQPGVVGGSQQHGGQALWAVASLCNRGCFLNLSVSVFSSVKMGIVPTF